MPTAFNPLHLACPLDGASLELRKRQLVCPSGHSFDVARQGYVNLLPVQHKRSKQPGDSAEMIAARTRFLQTGAYAPISDTLNELVCAQAVDSAEFAVMDAGCGDGSYLASLMAALGERDNGGSIHGIGLDISKPAVLAAARSDKQITWLVGTNRQPPVLPGSLDTILCLFGFPQYGAFKPLLRAGGTLVLVDPGPDHLIELRRIIYPDVTRTESPSLAGAEATGFRLQDTRDLCYTTDPVPQDRLMDLLAMTPHLYRASRDGLQTASHLESLALTVHVHFRVLG